MPDTITLTGLYGLAIVAGVWLTWQTLEMCDAVVRWARR